MTQLAIQNTSILPTRGDWQTMHEMADVLIKSGLAPESVKTSAAAIVIMAKGRELGIPPLYALSNIAVVKGKPVAGAEVLQAVIYRDHGDNALRIIETDANACTIAYKRRQWPDAQEYTFSIADAKQAGLMNNPTWQKYPQAMLRARCISAVARMAFADSIGGMYTPEELGASVTVSDEGEVQIETPRAIEAAPEPIEETPAVDLAAPEQIAAYNTLLPKATEAGFRTKRNEVFPHARHGAKASYVEKAIAAMTEYLAQVERERAAQFATEAEKFVPETTVIEAEASDDDDPFLDKDEQ